MVESLAAGRPQPEKAYAVKGDLTTQRALSGVKGPHKHVVRDVTLMSCNPTLVRWHAFIQPVVSCHMI